MQLMIHDLKTTTLTQDFTLDDYCQLGAVRLGLIFANDPSGSFIMTLKHGSSIIEAVTLTMAEIIAGASWTAGQYHHGFLTFELENARNLIKNETYTIELSSTGYTYSASSYIAWQEEHENIRFNGYLIELWKLSEGKMRTLNFFDGFISASAPTNADIEISTSDYLYFRQTSGVDTSGDFRQRVNSGVLEIQKYSGSAWETVETFELGA